MKRKTVFLLLLIWHWSVQAQKAIVVFQSDEPVVIRLHAPVDGFFNQRYPTDTICLMPKEKYICKLDVDDLAFVSCRLPKGKIELLLFPNDSLMVTYEKGNAVFSGTNAEGLFYWNFDYPFSYTDQVKNKLNEIFQDSVNIQWIQNEIKKIGVYDKLDALEYEGKVTSAFADVMRKNVGMHYNYNLIAHYYNLKENALATADTREKATMMIDSLFSSIPPTDEELVKYPLTGLYEDLYLSLLYDGLDDKQKLALLNGHDEDAFGAYRKYLLLPDKLRLPVWFEAFIMQFLYKVDEFDKTKMYKYLVDNYPDTESVCIIKHILELNKVNNKPFQHSYLASSADSLQDLLKAKELQNKWILVDVWATWCLPCRQEFQHAAALHEWLKQYPQIAMVYLSIDRQEEEKQWKKDIELFRLEGYHLRASQKMRQDITEKFFQGGSIFVPRYILLNKDGEIVIPDLPRPSDINAMKNEIEKELNMRVN